MAAIDRSFNVIPLCRMDYSQPSDSYLQRTDQPGIVESPFLAPVNQGNGISMANTINLNNAYFNMYSHCTSSLAAGSSNPNMESAQPFHNFTAGPAFSATTCTGLPVPVRKKHKRQEDSCECPLKKKKLSVTDEANVIPVSEGYPSSASIFTGDTSEPCWKSASLELSEEGVISSLDTHSSVSVHPPRSEDMEQTLAESPCDAAQRKIRDIESSLIIADEEIETETSHLPTLIMSDLLKASLKQGFEESITRKIVESMNRPSMEIVLWKPQPECLIDKLQLVSRCCKNENEVCKDEHIECGSAFPQKLQTMSENELCTSNLNLDTDSVWNREEEEEMEL
ncbi:coiled-coil domain-containing protein 117 [Pelodytes ibericus]